jgi:hypothetical protein
MGVRIKPGPLQIRNVKMSDPFVEIKQNSEPMRNSPRREEAKLFIRAYRDEHNGYPNRSYLEKNGFSPIVADRALGEVLVEDRIAPSETKFTKAQNREIDARVKVRLAKMEEEFDERVRQAMLQKNEAFRSGLEKLKIEAQRKFDLYEGLVNKHKPLYTEAEFTTIIMCLHPDNSASKEKRDEAFKLVNLKKLQLMGKK